MSQDSHSKIKGFSLLEIFLAILVVAILGSVAWRVWDARNDSSSEGKTNSQRHQEKNKVDDETASDVPSDPAETTYLNIPELGVRMPLEAEAGTIEYKVVEYEDSTPSSTTVLFSSRELRTAGGEYCGPESGPLGSLSTDPDGQILVGDRHFNYIVSPALCSDDPEIVRELTGKQLQALHSSIQRMEPIENE